jgi:DNA polymerase-1
MSIRGIKFDIDTLSKLDLSYAKRANRLLIEAVDLPEVKSVEKFFKKKFNPKSPLQVRKLLLEEYKLPILKTTKKDNPQLQAEELTKYAEEYKNPYCIIMDKYRSIETIRENFLSGVLPKLNNDIAHTTYSLFSTTTGRPNSKDPNLLNFPATKEFSDVKKVLVARPDHVFVYADLSQIEVRVAAMLSQDPELIKICNTPGADFHSEIASRIHHMNVNEFLRRKNAGDIEAIEIRRKAKITTFSILYGKTAFGLAYDLGISVTEAEDFIARYFGEFPGLKKYMDSVIDQVVELGYVDTYFGFRRTWDKHTREDHKTLREAQNAPIQGTAWNLMELALVKVDKDLKDYQSGLNLQVYDSLCVETHQSEIKAIIEIIRNGMTSVNKPFEILNTVDMLCDIQIGNNLKDLEAV